MDLEHIGVVGSVWGDISRTAAFEKHQCSRAPAALQRKSRNAGRMPRQILAVIAVDMAPLLCPQLWKPHLTGVALNKYSYAPHPHSHMESLDREGTSRRPIPLQYTSTGCAPAEVRRLTVNMKRCSGSPSQRKSTANTAVKSGVGLIAPLRGGQSPVKGQSSEMSGWEGDTVLLQHTHVLRPVIRDLTLRVQIDLIWFDSQNNYVHSTSVSNCLGNIWPLNRTFIN